MTYWRWLCSFSTAMLLAHGSVQAGLVDFVNGTWDHSSAGGSSSNVGWDSAYTTGSTIVDGVTVTLESLNHGTSVASGGNLSFSATGATTGFKFGNDGVTDTNGGTLANYQEWRLTFSSQVTDISWKAYDVDSHSSGSRWIDAVAAEAWNGSTGAIGTGTAVNWDLTGSELLVDSSTYAIDFVRRDYATHGHDNVLTEDAAGIAALNLQVSSEILSLYFFNDGSARGTHNIVNDGTFSFTAVPEPSALSFVVMASCLVFRRRRRRTSF